MKTRFSFLSVCAALLLLAPLSACDADVEDGFDAAEDGSEEEVEGASVNRAGELLTDRTFMSFTGSKYKGRYHIYAAGIDLTKPVGLLVYGDGSGEYGFDNPSSSYALGGSQGIVAQGKKRNMIVLVPESPNQDCECFHYGDPVGYTDWIRELIEKEVYDRYEVDRERIWLTGYSSGAQLVTRFLLPRHSELLEGGGTIVFGGGGGPGTTVDKFPQSLIDNLHMHWYTGANDTGPGGTFNALNGAYGAKAGKAWYADRGFDTSSEFPAGVGHGLSGKFGPVIGNMLELHDVVDMDPDPTEPDPAEPDPTEPDPTEPDPTEPESSTLEAEAMMWKAGSYNIWSDATASGGYKYIFWSNGGTVGILDASTDFSTLEIRGKGDHYGSYYPQARIIVDGVEAGVVAFDSESWQTKTVTGNWAAGTHEVQVEFINDYRRRNLILDSVTAVGN